MAHITAELFCTLDGIVSSPQDWHGPYWDAEAGERTEALLAASDVMLLGRNTYLEHAGYWPTDSGSMADLMNGIAKVVVSSTLESAEWSKTTVVRDGLDPALALLGDQRVVVTGSVALVRSLLGAGSLDELRLIIDPLVVGEGTRLFEGLGQIELTLLEQSTGTGGAISARYALGSHEA
jgi:dihydrofolate reductase